MYWRGYYKITSALLIIAFVTSGLYPYSQVIACPWFVSSQVQGVTQVSDTPENLDDTHTDNLRNQQLLGDPVFSHNGDYIYQHQDLFIPSRGLNVQISRTYKAKSHYNNRFGYGWDINYNKKIVPLSNGDLIYLNGELTPRTFGYLNGIEYTSPAGSYDKIIQNPDGTYSLTEKHGTKYNFAQNGCLTQIVDRNNNTINFAYDPQGKLPLVGVSPYQNDPTPKIIAYDYKLIQITDPVSRNITLNYDTSGHLSTIVDFLGRTHTYTYDSSGNGDLMSYTTPFTPQYPSGNTTQYAYENRNLTQITDARDQIYITNHYNTEDKVDQQTYGLGTYQFTYNNVTHQTTVIDPKGYQTIWQYNENGNPIQKTQYTAGLRPGDPLTYVTTYLYNANMELTKITYPALNSVEYSYGDLGNIMTITKKPAPGSPQPDIVTSFTYEPNFNFIYTITDPRGNVTTFNYDITNGNLTSIIYPQVGGQTPQTSFTYNQYGQLETVTDPNNNITRYEYYADTSYLWKIIQDPNSLNYTTQFVYDSVGNPISVTNARGHTTNFEYNSLNQLTKQIAPLPFNYQTKYTYDENGNLTTLERQADTQGTAWQTYHYTYNILDQIQTITDPLNNITSFEYDLNNNRASITDASSNITDYQYDERNLIWKTVDALDNTTEYFYDLNGNLAKIKDARGNFTQYAYDGFDRLEKTTYPDNSFKEFTYDSNSNLTQLINPNTEIINYAYDALNRLDLKTYPNQTTVDYIYDLGSRLTNIAVQTTNISYQYDALNRITQDTNTINSIPYVIGYQYDQLGNRSQVTYPSGTILSYTYDELNRLTDINNLGNHFSYTYDTLSRRTKIDMSNSTYSEYVYDEANRLVTLRNRSPRYGYIPFAYNNERDNPRNLFSDLCNLANTLFDVKEAYAEMPVIYHPFIGVFSLFNYTYDDVGNRLSSMHQIMGGQVTDNYGYDDIYQLTSDQRPAFSVSYDYDNVGNREVVTQNGAPTNYTANNLNQYSQVGAQNYTYDVNGNLTNDGINTYTYDYENRLITAVGTHNSSYDYDGLGRRISKTVDGVTAYFVYDGDRIIEERDASNQLIANYVYGQGIDEILSMSRNNQVYYYHYDGLGSVSDITDLNGYVLENYSYDVYGLPSQLSTIGNRYYFTGREYDSETGLYYYRARYYGPAIGRFLERDPLTWGPDDPRMSGIYLNSRELYSNSNSSIPLLNWRLSSSYLSADIISNIGVLNPWFSHSYMYVLNNPVNLLDPFGERLYRISGLNAAGGYSAFGITGGGFVVEDVETGEKGIYGFAAGGIGLGVHLEINAKKCFESSIPSVRDFGGSFFESGITLGVWQLGYNSRTGEINNWLGIGGEYILGAEINAVSWGGYWLVDYIN